MSPAVGRAKIISTEVRRVVVRRGPQDQEEDSKVIDQWFATSRFGLDLPAPNSSDSIDAAIFLIHAKQVGTTSSACGLNTLAWHKHWVPFHPATWENTCLDCIAVVAADSRSACRKGPASERIVRRSVTSE